MRIRSVAWLLSCLLLALVTCYHAATAEQALPNVVFILADDLGIKVGQLLGTLRVATSGLKVSPPLFESMEILGKERVTRDINRAIDKMKVSIS